MNFYCSCKINKHLTNKALFFKLLTKSKNNRIYYTNINDQALLFSNDPDVDTIKWRIDQNVETFEQIPNMITSTFTITYTLDKEHNSLLVQYKYFARKCKLAKTPTCPKYRKTAVICDVYWPHRYNYLYLEDQWWRVLSIKDHSTHWITPKRRSAELTFERAHFDFQNIRINSRKEDVELLMCIDFETCLINGRHQPYLGCAIYNFNIQNFEQEFHTCFFEHKDLLSDSTIGHDFVEWLRNLSDEIVSARQYPYYTRTKTFRPIEITWKIFGYNNNKFDNHFLYDALIKQDNCKILQSRRNGKVTQTVVTINYIKIKLCDLVSWIPEMTLEMACDYYEIESPKMPVNCVKYSELIEQAEAVVYEVDDTTFTSMINNLNPIMAKLKYKKYKNAQNKWNIYTLIMDYCERDVRATFEIYQKIDTNTRELINEIEKIYACKFPTHIFLDYISAAEISGFIVKLSLKSQQLPKLQILNNCFGDFIYSSCYGGRTDKSCVGLYSGNIKYMDVVSQYPLAMTGVYPAPTCDQDVLFGEFINLDIYQRQLDDMLAIRNDLIAKKEFHFEWLAPFNSYMGIFFCDVIAPKDEHNLITFGPIAQVRNMDKLVWTNASEEGRVLNTSQFKNLLCAGFRIVLREHKFNIIFLKLAPIFKQSITTLLSLKTQAKQAGNKAKGKLTKLWANSMAGKLAQRPTSEITDFSYNSTEYQDRYSSQTARETSWSTSFHYLSTFLTAEANFILYSVCYRLSLAYIYNKTPLAYRCGSLLYMDTDSIIFDADLVAPYHFAISQELGHFNATKCEYDTTWGEKYADKIKTVAILRKKSYILYNSQKQPLSITLKGIHKNQMHQFHSIHVIKQILGGQAKEISFTSLKRKWNNGALPVCFQTAQTNDSRGITQHIVEYDCKKTLQADKNVHCLMPQLCTEANAEWLSEDLQHFSCSPLI
jgi:hypothetical protein